MAGSILFLNTTSDYCGELKKAYEAEDGNLNYCTVSFINYLSIIGGFVELGSWVFVSLAVFFRLAERKNWQRL